MIIKIIPSMLEDYVVYLQQMERSTNTISKYVHDLRSFITHLSGAVLDKEIVMKWKKYLMDTYAPASVNSMLAAVNSFFDWAECSEYKVKPIKIQREIFTSCEKELTQKEYIRLVHAAEQKHNRRLSLLLQTICSTGIRVSELKYITVAAMQTGRAVVNCKGKNRTVFLPTNLCQALRHYCKNQGIESGVIFCTKSGIPLDRSNIWRDMKDLCESANVEPKKVFPHNLRHLFARTYYSLEKDLSRLADLLGHSSVNTTRIYTMESGKEHARQLDRMKLILPAIL